MLDEGKAWDELLQTQHLNAVWAGSLMPTAYQAAYTVTNPLLQQVIATAVAFSWQGLSVMFRKPSCACSFPHTARSRLIHVLTLKSSINVTARLAGALLLRLYHHASRQM